MKIKLFTIVLLILTIAFSGAIYANGLSVVVEDEKYDFDPQPINEDGKILVPMRNLFEALDVPIRWDQSSKTVTATLENHEINLCINSNAAFINGEVAELDMSPVLYKGTAFVPLRFISQALGYDVIWDEENRSIAIKKTSDNDIEEKTFRVSHTEEGTASWYGGECHGNKTASGEVFDKNALTAAHRNLPFNTLVLVTFPSESGKSIIVRINDRGPHDKSRIIDLSRAAAEAIDLHKHGIGEVKLEVLN